MKKMIPTGDAGERLSKHVAQLVPCSRSEAEKYIEGGWVQVDGQVVEEPQFRVLPQHRLTLDPNASLLELASVTLVLNKPPGIPWDQAHTLLNAASHCPDDPCTTRLLKRHFTALENLAPLETGSSGLMVFSQDWRTVRKLTEDMGSMEHELIVDVQGEVGPDVLKRITHTLNDERSPLPQTKVSVNSASPERSKLRFAVKGAHPGLAAHVCERAKLEILALRRIRLGRVVLSDLPLGQWRYLEGHERF
jgi:23S rRNA pseudouridine2604 synthase